VPVCVLRPAGHDRVLEPLVQAGREADATVTVRAAARSLGVVAGCVVRLVAAAVGAVADHGRAGAVAAQRIRTEDRDQKKACQFGGTGSLVAPGEAL